jgi:hypothetical protein
MLRREGTNRSDAPGVEDVSLSPLLLIRVAGTEGSWHRRLSRGVVLLMGNEGILSRDGVILLQGVGCILKRRLLFFGKADGVA